MSKDLPIVIEPEKPPHPKAGQARQSNRKGARQVSTVERMRMALEYRKAGLSYQAIADKVGWRSKSMAHHMVQKALRELVREPAEEVLILEIERLDRALVAIWNKVISGDVNSIRTMLSIMERRAKMLGLDAPAKSEVDLNIENDANQLTDEQLLEVIGRRGGEDFITPSLCQGKTD